MQKHNLAEIDRLMASDLASPVSPQEPESNYSDSDEESGDTGERKSKKDKKMISLKLKGIYQTYDPNEVNIWSSVYKLKI